MPFSSLRDENDVWFANFYFGELYMEADKQEMLLSFPEDLLKFFRNLFVAYKRNKFWGIGEKAL